MLSGTRSVRVPVDPSINRRDYSAVEFTMFKQAIAVGPVVAPQPKKFSPTRGRRLLAMELGRIKQLRPNENVMVASWLAGHSPSRLAWPGIIPASDMSIQVAYWKDGRFFVAAFNATADDRGVPAFKQARAFDIATLDIERQRGLSRFAVLAARAIDNVYQTIVPLAEMPSPLFFGISPDVRVPGVVPADEYVDPAAMAAEGWAMDLPVATQMAARLGLPEGNHAFVPFSRIVDAKASSVAMVAAPGLTQGRVTVNPGFECWGGLYLNGHHLRGSSAQRRAEFLAADDTEDKDVAGDVAATRLETVRNRADAWCQVACDGTLSEVLRAMYGNDGDDELATFIMSAGRTLYLPDQPGLHVVAVNRGPAGEIGRTWRSEGFPDLDLTINL